MEIKLQNVTKYYQDGEKSSKGIENVSLSFKTDGSFVVITGESGAGKTTLIKILTGLEDFDEGDITFDDVPLFGMSDEERHEIYSRNISFVFQDYNLVESFTAKENIKLALIRTGLNQKEADKKAIEVLKEVGLEKQINYRTSKLSGGERQRVAIARSLALETKIIIFDEPTGNLDQDTSTDIINLIEKIRKDRLIIYVTHEYQQVQDYVTRHIILKDGSVLSDTIIKEVDNGEDIKEVKSKSRKYSFLGKLYSAFLFAFRRPGRLIATWAILLLTSLACFGISSLASIAYGGIDVLISSTVTGSGVGNEVLVKKRDVASADITAPENTFVDKYDLLHNTIYSIVDYSDLDSIVDGSYKSNNSYDKYDANRTLANNEAVVTTNSVNANYIKNLNFEIYPYLTNGFTEANYNTEKVDNSIYIVLQSEYSDSYASKAIKECVGKEYAVLPFSPDNTRYDDRYSSYFDSSILSTCPKFVLSGVYFAPSSINYTTYSLYIPNSDNLNKLYNIEINMFENYDGFITNYTTEMNLDSSYLIDSNNVSVYCKSEDVNLTVNKTNDAALDITSHDKNCIYLDSYWKDKIDDLIFNIDGYEISASKLNNFKFFDTHTPDRTYNAYYFESAAFNLELISHNYSTRYYFKDTSNISSFVSSINKDEYKVTKYDAIHYSKSTMRSVKEMSTSTKIYIIFIFCILFGVLFAIMRLIRRILSNFYYRKDNDQMVLNYIGYTFTDILKINLAQFLTITLICNIIVYTVVIIKGVMFDYLSQLYLIFILSVLIDIIFSVYLSLPSKKRRKR